MAPTCGVCHEQESKYKCPICELRYCSIACYKPHKASHENDPPKEQPVPAVKDRPGTTQRAPKVDFTGFENDKDFQRLLSRYPLLRIQLQASYALTLEPGLEDVRSWNREALPGFEQAVRRNSQRGRGRGFRGGRWGSNRGGRDVGIPEHRQHGAWNQAKGDKEALDVIKKLRGSTEDEGEAGEGMREFVELCRIKFASSVVEM